MVKIGIPIALAIVMFRGGASAGGSMDYYFERIEGVTVGAGNAKSANAAVHIVDPWPARAGNRSIPASGERMSGAVRRYQDVTKLREGPRSLAPDAISSTGLSGGSAASGR